jgi:hypothetical protein
MRLHQILKKYAAGGAIAQAVSRWLPAAAARVPPRSGKVGFVANKVAWALRFPANLYSTKFSILTITGGRYIGPEVADMPSGPSLDSTPTMRIKEN